jgi:hypothetical protein
MGWDNPLFYWLSCRVEYRPPRQVPHQMFNGGRDMIEHAPFRCGGIP